MARFIGVLNITYVGRRQSRTANSVRRVDCRSTFRTVGTLFESIQLILKGNLIPAESNKGDSLIQALLISGDGEFNRGLPSRKRASM
jgi:hypothetical protein